VNNVSINASKNDYVSWTVPIASAPDRPVTSELMLEPLARAHRWHIDGNEPFVSRKLDKFCGEHSPFVGLAPHSWNT